MPAFYRGLAESGYAEGRNVAIEHHAAYGQFERRRELAIELVRRRVTLIVAESTSSAQEAKAATSTTPIVFLAGGDPVEFGLVTSLNRPGGNITGVALLGIEITGKRLELLRKLVPTADLIGALVGRPEAPFTRNEVRDLQSAARILGMNVIILNVSTEGDVAEAVKKFAEQRVGAILLSSNLIFQQERSQIVLLAARHAIPTMFWDNASAEAGALSSYGPDFANAFYQVGVYAGRILKGEARSRPTSRSSSPPNSNW
jgi:putative ABC transport system substrate-binding protein